MNEETDIVSEAQTAPPPPPTGPIAQSVAIGFRAIYVATLLLALLWLTTNVREIAADSQAVVFRFGRIVRSQQAGLLVAWPRPIETVRLLPGTRPPAQPGCWRSAGRERQGASRHYRFRRHLATCQCRRIHDWRWQRVAAQCDAHLSHQ